MLTNPSTFTELNFSRKSRLPVVQSAELAECGLACLAMIGAFHGLDINLNGLRQRYGISLSGTTLRGLVNIADELGFLARALRVDLDALSQVRRPAILHWGMNHFVVLKQLDGRKAIIHDPSRGARICTLEEVSDQFTGVVLELEPAAGSEPVRMRASTRLSDFWSRIDGFWTALGQILLLSAVLQIAAFAAPFQLQLVVDDALYREDSNLLITLSIAFGAIALIRAATELLRGLTLQFAGLTLTFQIVSNVVRHLLRLKIEYFEKRHVADIISRVSSVNVLRDILTRGVITAIVDGAMALGALIVLFTYSPTMAAVVLISVTTNFVVASALFPLMRSRHEEQILSQAREQSHLMESVRAAQTIRVMGAEPQRVMTWRNLYSRWINASASVGKFQLTIQAVQTVIDGLSTVVVIYLGARMVLDGQGFSVGMLVAFLAFRVLFADRTNNLINQLIQFRFLGLHLERLSDIVTAEPDAPVQSGLRSADSAQPGRILLKRVSFAYGANERLVLHDVSLAIEPDDFVVIVGPSGSGKTTLIKLLLGLLEPTEGVIELDGVPANAALWRQWRGRSGVVAQDDRLLSGTIAENIAFFDPDLDMGRVVASARAARIHDDIARMPMQYMALVGDMGSAMSGGQKQRVLLARALYRQPQVLYLDEGTANLDGKTEDALADLVATLQMTRIVSAHGPAFVSRATRIFRTEDGQVTEVANSPPA